ncbi:MAG TPA: 3-hydroxyacyl-CoA dehydrogenase [Clostridiales bacterium]|nr:3-hydroxyacyl-CoA dehydrogenase [Clostridiales bacterium]
MRVEEVRKICVLGCGNMGSQIALNAAIHGFKVWNMDVKEEMVEKARAFTEQYLPGRVRKGRLTQEQAEAAAANITYTTDMEEAARGADFVIEAVSEKLDLKRRVFRELDRICPPDAVLATNSSFIVSSRIADVTGRPDKVCNMHFFNPALVMELVEVVQGPHTSDETARLTMELARKMGKTPVLLKKEVYGFLVNRILAALMKEALWLADMEVAGVEDIDTAVTKGLGHPMGPFRLMDLTGIDLHYDIAMERYRETGDPAERPSPLVVEKVVKGEFGRKTGKGWYEYGS